MINRYRQLMEEVNPSSALIERTMHRILVTQKSRHSWKPVFTAALCALTILLAVPSFLSLHQHRAQIPVSSLLESQTQQVASFSSDPQPSSSSQWSHIVINQLEAPISGNRKLNFGKDAVEEIWGLPELVAYYGQDLRPHTLPSGLQPCSYEKEPTYHMILSKDGSMLYDAVSFLYSESFSEEYDPLRRTLQIDVSRIGAPSDCIYVAEEELKPSTIAGCTLTIGYRAMSYGPYDPQTHTPSGYYDLYLASFQLDGITFEIVSQNISKEEFISFLTQYLEQINT